MIRHGLLVVILLLFLGASCRSREQEPAPWAPLARADLVRMAEWVRTRGADSPVKPGTGAQGSLSIDGLRRWRGALSLEVESASDVPLSLVDPVRVTRLADPGVRPALLEAYGRNRWEPLFLSPNLSIQPVSGFLRFLMSLHELGLDPFRFGLKKLLRYAGGHCRIGFFDDGEEVAELEAAIEAFVPEVPRPLVALSCDREWWPDGKRVLDFDVLLAEAFFKVGSTLAPEQAAATMWQGAESAVASLVLLLPHNARYFGRVAALRRFLPYWSTASLPTMGTWGALKPGDFGPRVTRLKRRLAAEGFLDPALARGKDKEKFDAPTRQAVMDYREAYGLRVKGSVDKEMLALLNLGAEAYVKALWQSLNATLASGGERGGDYLLVNIPEFATYFYREGRPAERYRSVVGFPYQEPGGRTPTLSATVSYLDFNPTWTPTPYVLDKELKVKASKEASYLARNGFVLKGDKWVQTPGPHNTLGQVVIAFPNENNIALHGTNEPERFEFADRALSHGCVRVDDIAALAERILAWDSQVMDPPLKVVMRGLLERRVQLSRRLPVHIIYDRVRVLDRGRIALAPDPYKLQKKADRQTSLDPLLSLVSLARKARHLAAR
jgi:peptidoglycan hydrolase-like protein with peptidoglycan-binding domain